MQAPTSSNSKQRTLGWLILSGWLAYSMLALWMLEPAAYAPGAICRTGTPR